MRDSNTTLAAPSLVPEHDEVIVNYRRNSAGIMELVMLGLNPNRPSRLAIDPKSIVLKGKQELTSGFVELYDCRMTIFLERSAVMSVYEGTVNRVIEHQLTQLIRGLAVAQVFEYHWLDDKGYFVSVTFNGVWRNSEAAAGYLSLMSGLRVKDDLRA